MITANSNRFAPNAHPRNAEFGLKTTRGQHIAISELNVKL